MTERKKSKYYMVSFPRSIDDIEVKCRARPDVTFFDILHVLSCIELLLFSCIELQIEPTGCLAVLLCVPGGHVS